jgi:RimJ/RimL family protein N-acetyltransferase
MGKHCGGNDFPHAPSGLGSGAPHEHQSKNPVGRGEDHPPHIRPYAASDWPDLWRIIGPILKAGDTYPQPPDTSEAAAKAWWIDDHRAVFTAEIDGVIVGTYYLTDNKPGLGSHVANAGYMVGPRAQGRGVGRAMGVHSLKAARALGYLALQFNLVVVTNEASIRIWDSLGFTRVGLLPRAFRRPSGGYVDALVMYKWLDD